MIPVDIRNVNNLSYFTLKIKSWILDGSPGNLCRAYICEVGYINLRLRLINLVFRFFFFLNSFPVNMLMRGIKICFYCIFVYNGVNSPLICDFVKPTLIY